MLSLTVVRYITLLNESRLLCASVQGELKLLFMSNPQISQRLIAGIVTVVKVWFVMFRIITHISETKNTKVAVVHLNPIPSLSATWEHNVILPLTSCHLWRVSQLALGPLGWETWPCFSPAAAQGRAGTAPHLGSTLKLTLLAWTQVIWIEQESCPCPSLVCHAMARVREIAHPPRITTRERQERRPLWSACPSPSTSWEWALGLTWAEQSSWPSWCTYGWVRLEGVRAEPAVLLAVCYTGWVRWGRAREFIWVVTMREN